MMMAALVGIDIHDELVSVARITTELGRPTVESLDQIPLTDLAGSTQLNSAKITIGVSGHEVLVKNLKLSLPDRISPTEAGSFELAQSLIEPANEFIFAVQPTALPEEFIGLTYRLSRLTRLVDLLGFAPGTGLTTASFQIRSLALSRAFTTYCQPEPGELIGLVDLTAPTAAIVLIYQGEPISLASMPFARADLADDKAIKQLTVQLRTLINFQISKLATDGLSVPLATLLLSGEQADERLISIFSKQFPTGVRLPAVNQAFLSNCPGGEDSALSFLVPMGLAVN